MNKKMKLLGLIALIGVIGCKGMEHPDEEFARILTKVKARIKEEAKKPELKIRSEGNGDFLLKITNSTTQKYYGRLVDFSKWTPDKKGGLWATLSAQNKYLLLNKYEINPGQTVFVRFSKLEFPLSPSERGIKLGLVYENLWQLSGDGYFYYSPFEETIESTKASTYEIWTSSEDLAFEKIDTKENEQSILISSERENKALFDAVERGDYEQVKALIGRGIVDVNFKISGRTPLMVATQKGNALICKLLLDTGAQVKPEYWLQTALEIAARNNFGLICRLIIERGQHVDFSDIQTALHIGVENNNADMIFKILYAVPFAERKEMKKTIYAGLLALKNQLPKDVVKYHVREILINDLVNKRMNEVEKMINAIYPAILQSHNDQLIQSLSLDNPQTKNEIRENIRKNIMGVLFGKTRISSTMETYQEQKQVKKVTMDTEKVVKTTDLTASESNYYRILGVPFKATSSEIQEAFENRIQPYITEVRPSLTHRKLQEAYDTLRDPKKRAAYDKTLILRQ